MKSIFSLERYYFWIIITSLFVNLTWIICIPTQPFPDFLFFHELAQQIAKGGIWGNTFYAVGYPVFLAFFYRLFGSSLLVAKSLNIVLTFVSCILFLRILKILPLKEWTRRGAFLAFVFFPTNIYYNSIVSTEIFFTSLLLLIFNIYFSNIKYKYWLIGLLTGLMSLVKPFFPAFVLIVFLIELISQHSVLLAMKRAGIVLIICLLAITPWLYRNYKLIGEFTYISNNSGIILYINNNSQNIRGVWMPAADVAGSIVNKPEYQTANATQKNKMLSKAAKQWIINNPGKFMILGFKRIDNTYFHPLGDSDFIFYGTNFSINTSPILTYIAVGLWVIVFLPGIMAILVFSFYYLYKAAKKELRTIPHAGKEAGLLLTFLMFTGIYFVTEGQTRYAFPLVFILVYFTFRTLTLGQDLLNRKLFAVRP